MEHYAAKEDYLAWEFPALGLVERVLIDTQNLGTLEA
jgi:hypothetical protein